MYPQQELSPELVLAYKEGLKHIKPELLHMAFNRAMRDSHSGRRGFRPSVGEICQAAEDEAEHLPPKHSKAKGDCELCKGTGFKMVAVTVPRTATAEECTAQKAAPCDCRNGSL